MNTPKPKSRNALELRKNFVPLMVPDVFSVDEFYEGGVHGEGHYMFVDLAK